MSKYLPIRVSTLRGDQPIKFDAYVRVAGKYILFCREGDSFENQRLERLKSKKLQRMYIPVEQEGSYAKYMSHNMEKAYDTAAGAPVEIRAQIIQGALQAAVEDLAEDVSNQAFYKALMDSGLRFKEFLQEDSALISLLTIHNHEFNIAHHEVNVAALAIAIAEETGFAESHPMLMPHLIVGALLHDVEHHHDNLNLSTTSDKLPAAQKSIYDRHAGRGAEKIKQNAFYDSLVATIVIQHEERIDGQGPEALKEKDLHQAAQIVAVANAFDQYLQYEKIDPKEALRRILIEKMGILSLDVMKSLQNALKKRNII
jgi:HD-GYP domain-containing protein (c-di-GMP phosphodiesterase class II)